MLEPKFKFRNIGQYVRNIVDPQMVALKQLFMSADAAMLKKVQDELEAMKAQLKIKTDQMQAQLDAFSAIEIGWIGFWPLSSAPADISKWLECNGQTITRAKYPDLYNLIGSKVPDYRGIFLRCLGGNSAALGVIQIDQLKDHTHTQQYTDAEAKGAGYYTTGGKLENAPATTGSVTGGAGIETRPINIAVRFFIRALR